jgi:hypothetical protein
LPFGATICPTQAFDSPYLHSLFANSKRFFVTITGINLFFVAQTRFLSQGGKLVIDRAEGTENKSQQHRFIPQDCRCRLDNRTLSAPGEFTPPFFKLC